MWCVLRKESPLARFHPCFGHVDDAVGQLLAFVDDVHVHGACLVAVHAVVHVREVQVAQLVAELVDFVLDVVGRGGFPWRPAHGQQVPHLLQGLFGQLEHLVDVLLLLFREPLWAAVAAPGGVGDVVAAVADALYLRHFEQHAADGGA